VLVLCASHVHAHTYTRAHAQVHFDDEIEDLNMKYFASLAGVTIEDVLELEAALLDALEWKVHVDPQDPLLARATAEELKQVRRYVGPDHRSPACL